MSYQPAGLARPKPVVVPINRKAEKDAATQAASTLRGVAAEFKSLQKKAIQKADALANARNALRLANMDVAASEEAVTLALENTEAQQVAKAAKVRKAARAVEKRDIEARRVQKLDAELTDLTTRRNAAEKALAGKQAEKALQKAGASAKAAAAKVPDEASNILRYRLEMLADDDLRTGGPQDATFRRWNDIWWERIEHADMVESAKTWLETHAPKDFSDELAERMVKSLRSSAMRPKSGRVLTAMGDDDTTYVQMLNAVLEIRKSDGRILVHEPHRRFGLSTCVRDYLDFQSVRTEPNGDRVYTPLAVVKTDSMLGDFLRRLTNNPALIDYLAEALAMSLTTTNWQKAVVFYGPGGNGKSTLLALLAGLHEKSVEYKLRDLKHNFRTAMLEGATLVTIPEASDEKFSPDDLKGWISRDGQIVENKGQTPFSITPSAMFFLAINRTLSVQDHTEGFNRRMIYIPLLHKFHDADLPEEDQDTGGAPKVIHNFHKKILDNPAERRMWLDLLLSGMSRLMKRGTVNPNAPIEVQELQHQTRLNNDPVYAYITDSRMAPAANVRTSKNAIYQDYRRYCEVNGYAVANDARFWERVKEELGKRNKGWVYKPEQLSPKHGRAWVVRLAVEGVDPVEKAAPPVPPVAALDVPMTNTMTF